MVEEKTMPKNTLLVFGLLINIIGIVYQIYFRHQMSAVDYFSPYTLKQFSQYEITRQDNNKTESFWQQWNTCESRSLSANKYCFVEMNNINGDFSYKIYLDPYNNIYMVVKDSISLVSSENMFFYPSALFNPIEKMPDVLDPICEMSKKREFQFDKMRATVTIECSAIYNDELDENTIAPNIIRIRYKYAQNLGLVSYDFLNRYSLKLIGIKDD